MISMRAVWKKWRKKAPQLLKEDFNMNQQLKYAWKKAEFRWHQIKNSVKRPKGFHDFHGTALVAYTGSIYSDFNKAVREFKKNSKNFHYKAFHYYLTRALQLLRNNNCYTVYRGSKTKFFYSGGSVRFGQFASSSLKQSVAFPFCGAQGTMQIIRTCLGVYIKPFSIYPNEEEVLIPGYEVYQKVKVIPNKKGCDQVFLDFPVRKKSNFNCFYSGSPKIFKRHVNSSGAKANLG